MFRISAYVPVCLAILVPNVVNPQLISNSLHALLENIATQSFMSGLNYANRGSSSASTYTELAIGCTIGITSAVVSTYLLRYWLRGPMDVLRRKRSFG